MTARRYLTGVLFAAGVVAGWWAARRDVAGVAGMLERAGRHPVPPHPADLTDLDDDEDASGVPADDTCDPDDEPMPIPFKCDVCGDDVCVTPEPVDGEPRVVIIKWSGEYQERFRWVLRLAHGEHLSLRPITQDTARVFNVGGVRIWDTWTPTVSDEVVAALLEWDET